MLKYFTHRIFMMLPMILVISLLVFIALEQTPGDPMMSRFSPETITNLTLDQLETLRETAGLNKPMLVRYLKWLSGLLQGDLGYSITTGARISDIIANLLPATIWLSLASLLFSVVLGLGFGILSAVKHNSFIDYLSSIFGVIGISMPEFFIGVLAILFFAIRLKWLPAQGRTEIGATFWVNLKYILLPAMSLGITLTAALTRYTRNSMLDVMNQNYVKTARAKGLPEWKVFTRHVFRNALMPISVLVCLRLPMLVGGAVVIEQVFGYAGIGQRLLSAINNNDYQLVLIIIFLLSIVSLLSSLLIDLLTGLLDPRVHYG